MKRNGREAVILDAVRTPIGKRGGVLSEWHPVDLVATLIQSVMGRIGIPGDAVDDVILGCVDQVGQQALNVARSASLGAGLPISVPGVTIDRQCGSAQQAVHFAAQAIMAGSYDYALAGGVESMSRVPMYSNFDKQSEPYGVMCRDRLGIGRDEFLHQSVSAEAVCDRWQLSRGDLDEYSYRSHMRATEATESGVFKQEILPLRVGGSDVDRDEGIRSDTSLRKLSALAPAFSESGRITAGNSSQISDGGALLLLGDRARAERDGLRPRAVVRQMTVVGSDPIEMLTGPISATRRLFDQSGFDASTVDVFEVNEAFAPVPLIWMKEIGVDEEKVNAAGGAIALGHPLGATGARLIVTMLSRLEEQGSRFGVATICEAGGMANAILIERLA